MGDVEEKYPAEHYVMVDDKPRLLTAIKGIWENRVTTVLPRQGHYALDSNNLSKYPPPDITVDRLSDLLDYDPVNLLAMGRSDNSVNQQCTSRR